LLQLLAERDGHGVTMPAETENSVVAICKIATKWRSEMTRDAFRFGVAERVYGLADEMPPV
jgi:hypothetical protein